MIRQEGVYEINGVGLFLKKRGTGLPFLWTHGLLGSMELEEETGVIDWPRLEAGALVLKYDVRGHGRSEASLFPRDYRWENLAYDLGGLIDRLGIQACVLGGQSMGAVISLFLALLIPERVRGLILVTPPALWEEGVRHGEIYEFAARVLASEGMEKLVAMMKERHDLTDRQLIASPEITERFVQSLVRRDPRVVSAILRGAAETGFPPRERLKELQVPTLILAWTEDELHPLSSAKALHGLLASSRLWIAKSRAEIHDWSRLIGDFLSQVQRGYS